MSGYVIAQIEVTNHENYKEYLAKVTNIVKKFDGEFLVRGGEFEHVEGTWKHSRNIIVKFPSYERALEWYNSEEYAPLIKLRQSASEGDLVIVDGVK